jgi:diaminohydroxyphosphoribosylaminopyrimidine deaminase/5-amino-6-(5-phosphoribosylamino)uracil reductase
LQGVGIEVIMSGLDSEVEAMDPAYFHHRRTGRPLVTLKAALTLDGQLAARDGTSQWITSEAARRDAHRLRAEADAIVVGAGTALADDPALTVRLPGYAANQPVPVVVGGRRPIPNNLQIFARDALVFAPAGQSLDAEVVILPAGDGVDLEKMILALAERGLLAVMVEGGAALASALLRAELIDRAVLYYGAKLAGGSGRALFAGEFETLSSGREVEIVRVATVGPDVRLDVNLKARQ